MVKAEGSKCAQSIEELQRQTVEIVQAGGFLGLGLPVLSLFSSFWGVGGKCGVRVGRALFNVRGAGGAGLAERRARIGHSSHP